MSKKRVQFYNDKMRKFKDILVEIFNPENVLDNYRSCIKSNATMSDIYSVIALFPDKEKIEGIGQKDVDYIIYDWDEWSDDCDISEEE